MAGIGFELQRMIDEGQGLVSRIRSYACAGLISSGPWIMTIFTLGIISAFGHLLAPRDEFEIFRGLVTYAFAFSLIVVGVMQMAVTRRIADQLYTKEYQQVLPGFAACAILLGLFQALLGGLFCLGASLPLNLSLVSVTLYVVVSITWLALIWLGITREFDTVLKGYGIGCLVTFAVVASLRRPCDALGLMSAYTAGQAVILAFLMRSIARGLATGGRRDFSILRSIVDFPQLVLVGLLYNAAIWVDKIIFWFTDGIGRHPWILFHPLYDTCCFLAYLTVIPALAVNLVRVETSFYECYRSYFGAILGGMPLSVIDDRRSAMFKNMRDGMVRLLRIQGFITITIMIFAPYLLKHLELPATAIRIFRAVCVGAFFHVMLLVTILMQLYFDLRRQALVTSVLFLCLNASLAFWSVAAGISTYGFGYAIAALVSLLIGYTQLTKALDNLDYYVFTSQPITAERKGPQRVPMKSEASEVGSAP
ncbi:MAG: exopolysaccharide Pel transporter PelG [Planctomycetota bacterium]